MKQKGGDKENTAFEVSQNINSKKLQEAEDELRKHIRMYILKSPEASERGILSMWFYVTSRHKEEWHNLLRGLQTYLHKNPYARRKDIKELYNTIDQEIYTNKSKRHIIK